MHSFLLFLTFFTILQPGMLMGLVGVNQIVVAGCSLLVLRRTSTAKARYLIYVFLTAVAATAFASLQFPEAIPEYIKCLANFALSLFTAYIAFRLIQEVPQQTVANICFLLLMGMIVAGTAEMLSGEVKNISVTISKTLYVDSDSLELAEARDERFHGGFWRPILGSQEPSWVGLAAACYLTGWNLCRRRTQFSGLQFLLLLIILFAIFRTQILLGTALVGAIPVVLHAFSARSVGAIFLPIAGAVIALITYILIGERYLQIFSGDDNSTLIRLYLPAVFTYLSAVETWGMGTGFLGRAAEPGNPALAPFLPLVVEACQISRVEFLLDRYDRDSVAFGVCQLPFLTHWTFHGFLFGTISAFFWYCFAQSLRQGFFFWFLVIFFGLSLCGLPYESTRFLTLVMAYSAFFITYFDEWAYSMQSSLHSHPHAFPDEEIPANGPLRN